MLAYAPSEGKVIGRSSRSYGILPTEIVGRAEQNTNTWMDAMEECFMELGALLKAKGNYQISGIGVSGQQHGMVCLDDDGNVLRPAKLWCDVEAALEAREIQKLAKFKFSMDVSCLTPGFTSPKILWLKRNEPEIYDKTRWFVLPHDYVTMKLCGNSTKIPITDAGDASGNGVFDNIQRQNSRDLASLIDDELFDKLPKITSSPNAITGHLDDSFVEMLGIQRSGGDEGRIQIPVSVGSGDNMCAALGVGCVVPGQAVLSLGTSGTLFGVSDTPIPTNTPLAPFCDATGRHLPLACTMSCTGVLTHVLQELTPYKSHEEASEAASKIPIGCYGIMFLPYLAGERTPNIPHATGSILGLTQANLQYANDPAVLYRACMEGITIVLANALQLFPNKIDMLLVVGGGANNPVWRQIIADCLNCTLKFPLETESAALGAAFQAAAASTESDVQEYVFQETKIPMQDEIVQPQNVEAYEKVLQQFNQIGKALYGA